MSAITDQPNGSNARDAFRLWVGRASRPPARGVSPRAAVRGGVVIPRTDDLRVVPDFPASSVARAKVKDDTEVVHPNTSQGQDAPGGRRDARPTQRHRATGLLAALLLLAPTAARAQSPPKAAEGYNAFRLLRTRNVFDPERRAAVSSVAAPRPQPTATRANFIILTGTMVSPEKSLAFFTGSRPEFSKVITVGSSIADFKLTGITGTQVEMTLAGKPLTVVIGRQVPLTGSSVVSGPPPTLPDPAAVATPPSGTPSAPAPASDKNETLRRMMEARQKEMSK